MTEKTEQLLTKFREAAKTYASAKAEAVFLEHYRHVVLSLLMQAADAGGAKSIAAQDREARAADYYSAHLERLREAIKLETVAKAQMKDAELRIEVWRTEQATMRLERKAYNA